MLLKALVRRCVLGATGAYLVTAVLDPAAAYAQTVPTRSLALLPLQPTSFALASEDRSLARIAAQINTQVTINIEKSEETVGLTWDQVPIVRDFVDEDGNVDMTGGSLPVSVSVSNFMDAYGVVVSTDFKLR